MIAAAFTTKKRDAQQEHPFTTHKNLNYLKYLL